MLVASSIIGWETVALDKIHFTVERHGAAVSAFHLRRREFGVACTLTPRRKVGGGLNSLRLRFIDTPAAKDHFAARHVVQEPGQGSGAGR